MRSEFFFLLGEEKNAKKAIGMLHGEILLPAAKVFRHMISSMLTDPSLDSVDDYSQDASNHG